MPHCSKVMYAHAPILHLPLFHSSALISPISDSLCCWLLRISLTSGNQLQGKQGQLLTRGIQEWLKGMGWRGMLIAAVCCMHPTQEHLLSKGDVWKSSFPNSHLGMAGLGDDVGKYEAGESSKAGEFTPVRRLQSDSSGVQNMQGCLRCWAEYSAWCGSSATLWFQGRIISLQLFSLSTGRYLRG